MKISLNWLKDFIEITEKDPEKIKAVITERTAEVETMENIGAHLANMVVGKITKIGPHPNADVLRICHVDDGHESVKVICGGSNIKEGMKVALAQIGAVVRWHGQDVMKIEKVKIRGEESAGMICASDEIGLEEIFPKSSEKEIIDLTHLEAAPGTPLAKALGLDDVIIDIDNHALTNRGDLFSHKGFAREFVANGLGKWKKLEALKIPKNNSPAPIKVTIQDKRACSRYCAVYLTGIEIMESPDWMKKRLSAVGIRPLNNIIDITNYVMMELGMPLHAFDIEKLTGKNHVMRLSKKGEKVVTLDRQEHTLPEDVVVLADENEIYDLCGIMGGYQSSIQQGTTKIWLHAPVFNGTLVRRASQALGHRSEASTIYEKGVNNEVAMEALLRAIELILELCPGARVASEIVDIKNIKPEKRVFSLKESHLERLIGVKIPPAQTQKILKDLGFGVTKSKMDYKVTIPAWRLKDILLEEDLIEEVARIYGYNKIPFTTPVSDITPPAMEPEREYEKKIKNTLVGFGFDEIYTFAFLGPELLKKCEMSANGQTIEIANPISGEISLMRQSLMPRMLETIEANLRYFDHFRLFEISKIYVKKDKDHEEKKSMVLATAGESLRVLQGVIEALGFMVLPDHEKEPAHSLHHPGRRAVLMLRGKKLGYLFEVHPRILKNFDIKSNVVMAEVDLEAIHEMKLNLRPKYQELSKFPSVVLDVSIAIPKREMAKRYLDLIEKTDQALIREVKIIDEYLGDQIGKEERALTYSITYLSPERTLTEEEVNAVHHRVIEGLKSKGAKIR